MIMIMIIKNKQIKSVPFMVEFRVRAMMSQNHRITSRIASHL